jgi:hypothetical protein
MFSLECAFGAIFCEGIGESASTLFIGAEDPEHASVEVFNQHKSACVYTRERCRDWTAVRQYIGDPGSQGVSGFGTSDDQS